MNIENFKIFKKNRCKQDLTINLEIAQFLLIQEIVIWVQE